MERAIRGVKVCYVLVFLLLKNIRLPQDCTPRGGGR